MVSRELDGSSALRWMTARAEFAPVCRESLGIGAALDVGGVSFFAVCREGIGDRGCFG